MNPVFNEMDHRLSVVKRWGILHTIQTQSVAEHCFNVARITEKIASKWFGMSKSKTAECVVAALHHDDLEAISGDMPSMVKPYFDEVQMEFDHSDIVPIFSFPVKLYKIIKLADKLEGYHFLAMEVKLGNKYVTGHHVDEWDIIVKTVKENWPNDNKLLGNVCKFMKSCDTDLSERYSRRGR